MARREAPLRAAFTLIELIVVIVIIGILAAMAIPRMSRGAAGAAQTALVGDLAVIRNAINMFAQEHQGRFPPGDDEDLKDLLTMYTDEAGTSVSAVKNATHKFGPYLVRIPSCPVLTGPGRAAITVDTVNSPPLVGGGDGWVYNPNTGEFIANSTDTDDEGKAYNTY